MFLDWKLEVLEAGSNKKQNLLQASNFLLPPSNINQQRTFKKRNNFIKRHSEKAIFLFIHFKEKLSWANA